MNFINRSAINIEQCMVKKNQRELKSKCKNAEAKGDKNKKNKNECIENVK